MSEYETTEEAAARRAAWEREQAVQRPQEANTGVWLAYYLDWSGFVVFADEIDALRHAVEHNMSVKYVRYGESPTDR